MLNLIRGEFSYLKRLFFKIEQGKGESPKEGNKAIKEDSFADLSVFYRAEM